MSVMTGPMQRFLPFLPPTGGTVDDPLAVEAADATQEDLEWLLACDGAEFWGVVRADPSLPALVDSYLRYARWEGLVDRHVLPVPWHVWHVTAAANHRCAPADAGGAAPAGGRLMSVPRRPAPPSWR